MSKQNEKMSKRIKTTTSQGRDYAKMLKDYFGFHLCGMEVTEQGGQKQAQVIYEDFRHIDTVRRDLAQMMPEVEFTKLRREYTHSACLWALSQIMYEDVAPEHMPVIYVQRGDDIMRTTLRDIAISELRQLELDEDDEKEIRYRDHEMILRDDENLRHNSWD